MTLIGWIEIQRKTVDASGEAWTREEFIAYLQGQHPETPPDSWRRELSRYEQRTGWRLPRSSRQRRKDRVIGYAQAASAPDGTVQIGPKPAGKTLDQFRAQFDVREKIRAGLSRIGAVYMTDTEFREFCGVPLNRWRRYADLEEFLPFRLRLSDVLYWASAEMIGEMKNIAGVM